MLGSVRSGGRGWTLTDVGFPDPRSSPDLVGCGVYAGSTCLPSAVFGRQRGLADSLDSCGFARPGVTCGDTGSTLVMMGAASSEARPRPYTGPGDGAHTHKKARPGGTTGGGPGGPRRSVPGQGARGSRAPAPHPLERPIDHLRPERPRGPRSRLRTGPPRGYGRAIFATAPKGINCASSSTSSSCRRPSGEHGPIGSGVMAARRHSVTEARKHLRYRSRDERVVGRHDRL